MSRVIKYTDSRQRGWVRKSQKNLVTASQRLEGVNIIAAMCSTGEIWYTANCGKTNSETFCFFLLKLCGHLDSLDIHWRKNTVIMLDNAAYHRGVETQKVMDQLRLPVLYLGPYHFRMAPVEMLFNYVKCRDLNPLRSHVRAW